VDPTGPYGNALGYVHPDTGCDAHGDRDPQAGGKRYLHRHLHSLADLHALCHLHPYADRDADLDSDDDPYRHSNRHLHQHADAHAYIYDNAHADGFEHGY
jgi:hypothetical protein